MSRVLSCLDACWPAPPQVRAFTTCRHVGLSQGPFSSFNVADHVGDDETRVNTNRQTLQTALQLPSAPRWLTQVHGDHVVDLDSAPSVSSIEADASLTRQAGVVCAVLTAECLPVVLCDDQGEVVAAVHAGWRGLAQGIVASSIRAMGVPAAKILVWLGPALSLIHISEPTRPY